MNSFVTYLRDVKSAVTTSDKPIRLAMGNTSGDMDSIVGAMGLGYLLTLKTGQMWTPVVNCAKDDLKLKSEIYCHLIDDCKLTL
jgi:inorganic pyrophosphatase/exopolyphosphatase